MTPHDIDRPCHRQGQGGTEECDPPLNDIQAWIEWLAGYGAAWVECPDEGAFISTLHGDGMGGKSIDAALARALDGP